MPSKRVRRWLAVTSIGAGLCGACAEGVEDGHGAPGTDGAVVDTRAPGEDGALPDTSTKPDSFVALDSDTPIDSASPSDTGTALDSATTLDTGGGGADAAGMDPLLGLPETTGKSCSPPGSLGACPSLQVCRIATPTGGRCESCTTCNNLGKPCSVSSDCDILFQCYAGKCANICPLGTSYCGAVADCLNVGHATHGVCKP